MNHTAQSLLDAASALSAACQQLSFGPPVHTVYNCFDYAYNGYAAYVSRFVDGPRRALLLGMNPGPWGMAQTGVPFGEVAAVRGWMGLQFTIASPANQHPARPVHGLDCPRSEVSGRRLWGLFSELFPDPDAFFARAFVMNYCPLAFLLESGANLTPDKLPADQRAPLLQACDAHLAAAINILQPQLLIGVGAWATGILKRVHPGAGRIATLLHPSPASPIANRHWPQRPIQQLQDAGFFD